MTIVGGRSASIAKQSNAVSLATSLHQISCQVAITEIPISEVVNDEATDYVIYFFGLDCYDKWRHLSERKESK
jgi:hypothetical protein